MFVHFYGVTITKVKLPWVLRLACKIPAACITRYKPAPAPQ